MKVQRAWQLWLWDEVRVRLHDLGPAQTFRLEPHDAARLTVTPDARLELHATSETRTFLNDVQLTGTAELRAGDVVRTGTTQVVVLARTEPPAPTSPGPLSRRELLARLDEELARALARARPPTEPKEAEVEVAWAILRANGRNDSALPQRLRALWPHWAHTALGAETWCCASLGGRANLETLADAAHTSGARLAVGSLGEDGYELEELREAGLVRLLDLGEQRWPEEPVALDPAMVRLAGWVDRQTRVENLVVFEGESGTGRSLWARRLHAHSARRAAPLQVIDCRAGLERALGQVRAARAGGVLLLSSLDALEDAQVQSLLAAAKDRGIIMATAQKTPAALRDGASVVPVPALRDRSQEILPLAAQALEQVRRWLGRRSLSVGGEARRALTQRAWPGNVRELRNAVWLAALAAESDEIRAENLPPLRHDTPAPEDRDEDLRSTLRATEKDVLLAALARTRWNVTQTARDLGLPRRTVVYRMSRLGLRRPE